MHPLFSKKANYETAVHSVLLSSGIQGPHGCDGIDRHTDAFLIQSQITLAYD